MIPTTSSEFSWIPQGQTPLTGDINEGGLARRNSALCLR